MAERRGISGPAERAGVDCEDRKIAARYVAAATEAGLSPDDGPRQLIGAVVLAVPPTGPKVHGEGGS